jgi:hypothetical protein
MKLIGDIHNVANVPKNGKGSYVKMFSQEKIFYLQHDYQIPLPPPPKK